MKRHNWLSVWMRKKSPVVSFLSYLWILNSVMVGKGEAAQSRPSSLQQQQKSLNCCNCLKVCLPKKKRNRVVTHTDWSVCSASEGTNWRSISALLLKKWRGKKWPSWISLCSSISSVISLLAVCGKLAIAISRWSLAAAAAATRKDKRAGRERKLNEAKLKKSARPVRHWGV